MRWRNHKLVTFSAAFSMTGGFIAAGAAMVGSVLPDVLELRGLIPHRTVTHYIWFWVSACVVLWITLRSRGFSSIMHYCIFFMVAGGLLHICEDALSRGGVPIYTPHGPHVGFDLYQTGTMSEELTVLGLVALFTGFAWMRGFLSSAYIAEQIDLVVQVVGRVAHF